MVNSLLQRLLAGLFPDYCSLCGLRSQRDLPLCLNCERELQANTACCHRCAIPLPPAPLTGPAPAPQKVCGSCQQTPPPYQRVVAPWLYCERLAYLIQRWKFHGESRLTPLLASLWLQQVDEPGPVDLIVPIPLHWRRLWQRGFNQSELLARQLRSHSPGLAAARLDHRSTRRSRPTRAQSGMGAVQRAANLRDAFTVNRRYDNLRIAIVDDVFTTGATAAALALTLRNAGAGHIDVWCLARTPAPGA
ncbi:MAG: ComF family protein [Pseudomonadales bacterium]|nr:ComF family protein [Halioglobus sp.]MCP5128537.1 ComF family protein [Pseudomonadales bacterium]